MISTGIARSSKNRRAVAGWAVATRWPARSSIGLVRRVVGDGRREPAASVAERSDHGQLGAGLVEEIDAGDPEVGHPVADELDHVVGPDEQDVEVVVLDQRDQASVVLLEHQAGVMQQPQRRLDEPALVGDREAQAAGHRSPATG